MDENEICITTQFESLNLESITTNDVEMEKTESKCPMKMFQKIFISTNQMKKIANQFFIHLTMKYFHMQI